MKVTVCFGEVKVVVPCGDGSLLMHQLGAKALERFSRLRRMAIFVSEPGCLPLIEVQQFAVLSNGGVIDWDDTVADVVDDREVLRAEFREVSSLCGKWLSQVDSEADLTRLCGIVNGRLIFLDWDSNISSTDCVSASSLCSSSAAVSFHENSHSENVVNRIPSPMALPPPPQSLLSDIHDLNGMDSEHEDGDHLKETSSTDSGEESFPNEASYSCWVTDATNGRGLETSDITWLPNYYYLPENYYEDVDCWQKRRSDLASFITLPTLAEESTENESVGENVVHSVVQITEAPQQSSVNVVSLSKTNDLYDSDEEDEDDRREYYNAEEWLGHLHSTEGFITVKAAPRPKEESAMPSCEVERSNVNGECSTANVVTNSNVKEDVSGRDMELDEDDDYPQLRHDYIPRMEPSLHQRNCCKSTTVNTTRKSQTPENSPFHNLCTSSVTNILSPPNTTRAVTVNMATCVPSSQTMSLFNSRINEKKIEVVDRETKVPLPDQQETTCGRYENVASPSTLMSKENDKDLLFDEFERAHVLVLSNRQPGQNFGIKVKPFLLPSALEKFQSEPEDLSNILNRPEAGLEVHSIVPGGRASRETDLKEGDRILEINGVNLCGLSFNESRGVFTSALYDTEIRLLVLPCESAPSKEDDHCRLDDVKDVSKTSRPELLLPLLEDLITKQNDGEKSIPNEKEEEAIQRKLSSKCSESTSSNVKSVSFTSHNLLSRLYNSVKRHCSLSSTHGLAELSKEGGHSMNSHNGKKGIFHSLDGPQGVNTSRGSGDQDNSVVPLSSIQDLKDSSKCLVRRQLLTISMVKDRRGFGFSIAARDIHPPLIESPFVVKRILKEGAALSEGTLRIGDQLCRIDDTDICSMTQAEVVSILREKCMGSSVQFTILRLVPVKINSENETILTKVVNRCNIDSRSDGKIIPSSPSISVDGISDSEYTPSISSSSAIVSSVALLTPEKKNMIYREMDICLPLNQEVSTSSTLKRLLKHSGRLGINLKSLPRCIEVGGHSVVYVESLVPGGIASQNDQLQVGDYLLSANNQTLLGLSHRQAIQRLKACVKNNVGTNSNLNLRIGRYASLSESCQATKPSSLTNTREESDSTAFEGVSGRSLDEDVSIATSSSIQPATSSYSTSPSKHTCFSSNSDVHHFYGEYHGATLVPIPHRPPPPPRMFVNGSKTETTRLSSEVIDSTLVATKPTTVSLPPAVPIRQSNIKSQPFQESTAISPPVTTEVSTEKNNAGEARFGRYYRCDSRGTVSCSESPSSSNSSIFLSAAEEAAAKQRSNCPEDIASWTERPFTSTPDGMHESVSLPNLYDPSGYFCACGRYVSPSSSTTSGGCVCLHQRMRFVPFESASPTTVAKLFSTITNKSRDGEKSNSSDTSPVNRATENRCGVLHSTYQHVQKVMLARETQTSPLPPPPAAPLLTQFIPVDSSSSSTIHTFPMQHRPNKLRNDRVRHVTMGGTVTHFNKSSLESIKEPPSVRQKFFGFCRTFWPSSGHRHRPKNRRPVVVVKRSQSLIGFNHLGQATRHPSSSSSTSIPKYTTQFIIRNPLSSTSPLCHSPMIITTDTPCIPVRRIQQQPSQLPPLPPPSITCRLPAQRPFFTPCYQEFNQFRRDSNCEVIAHARPNPRPRNYVNFVLPTDSPSVVQFLSPRQNHAHENVASSSALRQTQRPVSESAQTVNRRQQQRQREIYEDAEMVFQRISHFIPNIKEATPHGGEFDNMRRPQSLLRIRPQFLPTTSSVMARVDNPLRHSTIPDKPVSVPKTGSNIIYAQLLPPNSSKPSYQTQRSAPAGVMASTSVHRPPQ